MPNSATPDDIRAALSGYLDECRQNGKVPATSVNGYARELEKRLQLNWTGPSWGQAEAAKRFQAQVRAQLNNLARDGVLIKEVRNRLSRFYTPAAARQLDEIEKKRQRQLEETRELRVRLRERLGALGITGTGSFRSIDISLNDWDRLVTLAENGTALRRDA